jgi:hypothetical protein
MSISNDDREVLAGLADVLIPAGDQSLSASQAGVAGPGLDQVLAARPDLAAGLQRLLALARDHAPEVVVARLKTDDPAAFGVLAEVTAGAYFMNPAVREAIGYRGQAPHAIDPRVDYMEDGLLESVIRRGPIYRPTPGQSRSDILPKRIQE